MEMDFLSKIEGKHFILYSIWILGNISEIANKLAVIAVLWKILWKT